MKKIFLFMLVIVSFFVLSSCGDSNSTMSDSYIENDENNENEQGNETEDEINKNSKPYFIGPNTVTIELGRSFNLTVENLSIYAYDDEDGDLSHLIQINGYVNIYNEGTYNIELSITDSDNETTTMIYKVVVYRSTKNVSLNSSNYTQYLNIKISHVDTNSTVVYKIEVVLYNDVKINTSISIDINISDEVKILQSYGAAQGVGTEDINLNLNLNVTQYTKIFNYTYYIQGRRYTAFPTIHTPTLSVLNISGMLEVPKN